MNNTKYPIKNSVKSYYASQSLSEKQIRMLQNKLELQTANNSKTKDNKINTYRYRWFGSIAASLLLISVVLSYIQTPSLIAVAYQDINKDSTLSNGFPAQINLWMTNHNIGLIPSAYRVEMGKFCQLDDHRTTHLRIAGVERGKAHFFFNQGNNAMQLMKTSGVEDNMNWKFFRVRKDLTLLVMYTHDMREEAVQQILNEMLPDLRV